MKRVTKKLQRFINSISVIGNSNILDDDGKIYYSKTDGSYLTRVGMENELNFLLEIGVTEQIQDGHGNSNVAFIGFNPKEQKWYGWSHRGIYGFGIGSECKKGDCGYEADNKENFMEDCLNFWGDDVYSIGDQKALLKWEPDYENKHMVEGVLITYTYNNQVPNKKLRGTVYSHFSQFPTTFGKGEWTAKTLEQAKEMAIDFAKGVS